MEYHQMWPQITCRNDKSNIFKWVFEYKTYFYKISGLVWSHRGWQNPANALVSVLLLPGGTFVLLIKVLSEA